MVVVQSFSVRWSEASLAAQFPVLGLPIQFEVTGTHLEQCTRQSYANGSAAFITWGYIDRYRGARLASTTVVAHLLSQKTVQAPAAAFFAYTFA